MRQYFISDIHLRLDRPERGQRLAEFVQGLDDSDSLVIVGDLCDFWMASRELAAGPDRCAGLRALADFGRRGGGLTILPGNHDAWLGVFYEKTLAAVFQTQLEVNIQGLRVHAVHGHLLENPWHWKRFMETRFFFHLYSTLPNGAARPLSKLLDSTNQKRRARNHARLKAAFRHYARKDAAADLYLFGHVHERVDEAVGDSRLVVLGDWKHSTSYLVVGDGEVRFVHSG